MKPFIILSKKRIFLSLAITVVFLLICFKMSFAKTPCKDGVSTKSRIEFLKSSGISGVADETKKEIVIPKNFNKVFEGYNNKLKKQGYDLSRYKGKNATLYTYLYNDFEVQLIVYNGEIISAAVLKDGEFKILSKNEKK